MWFLLKRKPPSPKPPEDPPGRRSERAGELGEYKLSVSLREFGPEARLLSDLLIPNPGSRTGYSQIDHLLVTPYALFVLECKNFGHDVKGRRAKAYWWSAGHPFFNPLKQNQSHIRGLKRVLRLDSGIPFISVVSFSLRARVTVDDPELRRISSDEWLVADVEVPDYIARKLALCQNQASRPRLAPADVDAVAARVAAVNITDPKIRQAHIEAIRRLKASPTPKKRDSLRRSHPKETAGGRHRSRAR